jgi:hypothetical protein
MNKKLSRQDLIKFVVTTSVALFMFVSCSTPTSPSSYDDLKTDTPPAAATTTPTSTPTLAPTATPKLTETATPTDRIIPEPEQAPTNEATEEVKPEAPFWSESEMAWKMSFTDANGNEVVSIWIHKSIYGNPDYLIRGFEEAEPGSTQRVVETFKRFDQMLRKGEGDTLEMGVSVVVDADGN